MDRNAEISNNAIKYGISIYLRTGETEEQMIKTHGSNVIAIQFLRNRGLSGNEPQAKKEEKKIPIKNEIKTASHSAL